MKKLSGMVLFIAFVLSCHSAFAMSGDELIDGMRSYLKAEKDYTKADYLLAGNYMGYVQGVAEATASDYSLPSGVTPEKLFRIVANYLEKHPKRLSDPATRLVRNALLEAFPKYIIRNK
ncbi:MAG: Rap1a/Tai family immunity protein [Smithellaceae bacterium]